MYHRGISWDEYLARHGFKDTIGYTMDRKTSAMAGIALDRGFGRLIGSQQQMYVTRQTGFAAISYTLNRIGGGIRQLRSDFDWAMGGVLWKLELQSKELQSLIHILQSPLTPQEQEQYQGAEHAYLNSRYDEALSAFIEAERTNNQNFAIYHSIGNIYLYHHQPAHLGHACAAYLQAGRSAEPLSPYYAALAYLHAAFVCYLQSQDELAVDHALHATVLCNELAEGWYNLAKFAAVSRKVTIAIPSLERIIRAERNYAVKVRDDIDFEDIEADVTALIDKLYTETRKKAEEQWQSLQEGVEQLDLSEEQRSTIDAATPMIEVLMRRDTYFGYLEALDQMAESYAIVQRMRHEVDQQQLREQTRQQIDLLRAEMGNYVILGGLQQWLNGQLREAEQLLTNYQNDADMYVARQKVNYCERSLRGGILTGHTHLVYTIAFSPDGQTLASGSSDKTIRLWDVASGQERAVLRGHSDPIAKVMFSPNGSQLASASADNTVRLWSLNQTEQRMLLDGHTCGVIALAFSPDSQTLASGSIDKTVRLWDTHNGEVRTVLTGHAHRVTAIAFNSDGETLASGSSDHTIYLWNVATGKQITSLDGHSGSIRALMFSPDGQILASASSDNTICLWDVARLKLLATLSGHTAAVKMVAFSPDGRTLASGSSDTTVRLWDIFRVSERAVLRGHKGSINTLVFSPYGGRLASGSSDATVRLWSVNRGEQRALLTGHTDAVNTLAFSPDGAMLASGSSDKTVRLWSFAMHKDSWEPLERQYWEQQPPKQQPMAEQSS